MSRAQLIALGVLKGFEGLRLAPYQDVAGKWTIGYGMRALPDGTPVTGSTAPISEEEADFGLETALAKVAARVDALVHIKLSDSQNAALYSLAYNIGTGAFGGSTLLRLLNAGRALAALPHFMDWVYSGGHLLDDLLRRRRAELQLFKQDVAGSAPTAPSPEPPQPAVSTADDLNAAELSKLTAAPEATDA
jgi:lysozyme